VKQDGAMTLIEEGIQIDSSHEQFPNAYSPRVESLDPASKVKSQRLMQEAKHSVEIVSIDDGRQID
jgi:hypothetical protein